MKSTVHLDLQRWDGAHMLYESTGEAVAEYGFGGDSAAVHRRLTTRVTWAALKRLSEDPEFYSVEIDKLKVTRPQALRPSRVTHLIEQVKDAAAPFGFAELYERDDSVACRQGLCVTSQSGTTADGATRSISRVASPSLGRFTVVAEGAEPSVFSPSEIPVHSRLLELANPGALSEHTPFGFCEVVVYNHPKNTRTTYTTCDQKAWTAQVELCRTKYPTRHALANEAAGASLGGA